MSRPFLLLVNGPPRSGKDAVGDYLVEQHGFVRHKMTMPMDRALQGFFGLSDEEFRNVREDFKDQPFWDDITFRDILISMSESWAKPLFGDDVMGKLTAALLIKIKHHWEEYFLMTTQYDKQVRIVVTDAGFQNEVDAVLENLEGWNSRIWTLERDGSQLRDSRHPLESDSVVKNNGTLEDLHLQIDTFMDTWEADRLVY